MGGLACPPISDEMSCNTHECPVDCVESAWTSWGVCDRTCGRGHEKRHRTIQTAARFGGTQCQAQELVEVQECNSFKCPVSCIVGLWTEGGKCTKRCDTGTMIRFRQILQPASNGGATCPPISDFVACNKHQCSQLDQCEVSDWGEYGMCTNYCGGGTRSRFRQVEKSNGPLSTHICAQTSNAHTCNTQQCYCTGVTPIPCVVSAWSSWDVCSHQCGSGTQRRHRSVLVSQRCEGGSCPELFDIQICNTLPCPVNCEFSAWTEWSACSMTCGGLGS
jgi:hypothetical protein